MNWDAIGALGQPHDVDHCARTLHTEASAGEIHRRRFAAHTISFPKLPAEDE